MAIADNDWIVPDRSPLSLRAEDRAPADVIGIDLLEQIRRLNDDVLLHIHGLTSPGRDRFRDRERNVSRAHELSEQLAQIEQTAGRLLRAVRREGV